MGFTWALWHTVGLIMAFLLWSRSRKSRLKRWCYLLALLLKNRFCVLPDLFFFIIYPGWLHFVFLQNDGALRWFSWGSMYSSRCIIKPNPNRWKENGKGQKGGSLGESSVLVICVWFLLLCVLLCSVWPIQFAAFVILLLFWAIIGSISPCCDVFGPLQGFFWMRWFCLLPR